MNTINQFINSLNLTKKLISAFLVVSLVPITIIIVVAINTASNSMTEQVYSRLDAVSEVKQSAVKRYFINIEKKLNVLQANPEMANMATKFIEGFNDISPSNSSESLNRFYKESFTPKFKQLNPTDTVSSSPLEQMNPKSIELQSRYLANNPNPIGEKQKLTATEQSDSYEQAHRQYHPYLRDMTNINEFYDIFIIDPTNGNIVYSVYKEVDFATSLQTGPYAKSNLASLFQQLKDSSNPQTIAFADYKQYSPSYNAPASFIGKPIVVDGKTIAILAAQLSIEDINSIMKERDGLGESGETYLVGPEGLMRSDSYIDPINHSVESSFRNPNKGTVNTLSVIKALKNEKGQHVISDYNNEMVLSAFAPVNVFNIRWALIAEMDEQEAFESITTLSQQLIIILLITIFIVTIAAYWFARTLTKPIHALADTMKKVEQQGDFSLRATVYSSDEIGVSTQAFNTLLDALQLSISETNRVMNHMAAGKFDQRIEAPCRGELDTLKQATNDCASSLNGAINELNNIAIAMADGQFDIQINASMSGELGTLKSNINQSLSSINNTMNSIVDIMANVEQGNFKEQITYPAKGKLAQLKDSVNNSVNSLSIAIDGISDVMSALRQGQFSAQLDAPLAGQLNTLKQDINSSMANLNNVMNEIGEVMTFVSKGDFKKMIKGEASGQLEQLKSNINTSITAIDNALTEISSVMLAISQGRFDHTISSTMTGQLNSLKIDINQSVTNLEHVINDLNQVMAAMANGDFSHQLKQPLQGQLEDLKNNVNESTSLVSLAINEVSSVLSNLAKGDLTKNIEGQYQGVFNTLKSDTNATIDKLTNVIQEIQVSASQVMQNAGEIASSNTEISKRTEEQAANLEEASSSTEQMLDELTKVSEQSKSAVALASNAEEIAEEGNQLSIQTVSAIDEVNEASKDINEILTVIDNLAFQTNLLSLNAAVEAARAGDHGRGFAVVANEVGDLAGRSAKSAKQIKSIIVNSNQKVALGTELADTSGKKLKHIMQAVSDVSKNIIHIAHSTSAQEQAIKEVNLVVQRLTGLTQANSAITEETMAAARQMAEQATEMRVQLNYFNLKKEQQ
ncbi:methyl-accepting chemotaxis protein [Pseudoalteromonas sp. S1609]|jgi:methyl-accepting chemotaxis protein|uniref:methyl-accepting chemotaxis protein n=1 Tax=Pseudoalteromonas sp. S1609 TaxID=579505 RepID=UPI00110B423C|nr:methyl-accepting chemotaxis protein [Pseudoalteromonas sp. S1609]TMP68871.1 methyl-accepting chemotaxis protein [Pseudoalteromonas sp. S1609]